jgi:hypothetical protein
MLTEQLGVGIAEAFAERASQVLMLMFAWFGRPVDAIFIQDGCGLPRWTKIRQIFN